MSFDVFINFDGDCREALAFYAQVFKLEDQPQHIMTYGQSPTGDVSPQDKDRVLYASLPIYGHNVMFSDCPTGSPYVKGTNIALTLGIETPDEMTAIYHALSQDGQVLMPLGETFFCKLFAMVTDKFGVMWQLGLTSPGK